MSIVDNYNKVLKEVDIASNTVNHHVDLLAVSKMQSIEKIEELVCNGVKKFGESKLQEAIPKIQYLSSKYNGLEFHFIGKLQTNKLKKIVEYFYLIHSVDKIELLEIIDKYAYILNKKQNILIQVNLAHEKQKNGISPDLFDKIIKTSEMYKNIVVQGLMFMPPYEEEFNQNKIYFMQAKQLFKQYKSPIFNILSMGMSHDFKNAIQYGSTLVRIGSSIFGTRE